jgi:hypothetical protein
MLRRAATTVVAMALDVLGAACSSTPTTQPAVIETSTTKQPVEAPFVMTTADLPAGFPPPGPVDHVIVKQYPAYRTARVGRLLRSDGQADAQGMFMALVSHVERNHFAPTTPVEATYAPPVESPDPESAKKSRPVAMSFIYASSAIGTPGPDPHDPRITVVDVPAATYISIGIRGGYSSQNFTAAYARLIASLAQSPGEFSVAGPPRYLFYNSPLVPAFASFGEVQLPVTKVDPIAASGP